MYSSSSVSFANISSPNSFKPSEVLWSMLKHVLTINQVWSHCLRATKKFCGKVTASGADRISTSYRDGVPVPEATMAYWSAWPRKKFLIVAVCWTRTKG